MSKANVKGECPKAKDKRGAGCYSGAPVLASLLVMSFEKLRVYQAAELLDREVQALVKRLPRIYARDVDQLKRAVGSILYNIAEANASLSAGRRRYHNQIAIGSSDETRAVLRRLVNLGALEPARIRRACALTSTIVKMLISITRKLTSDP